MSERAPSSRRSGTPARVLDTARLLPLLIVCLVALAAMGVFSVVQPQLALIAAVLLVVTGLFLRHLELVPVLAMPALVIVQRVGPGSANMSLSDATVFATFWFALLFAPRPFSRPMRSMLWLSAIYQVATVFTVIVNPYLGNAVEWIHTAFLVGGALIVGWAVGSSGRARMGLALLLTPCAVFALSTVIQWGVQLATGETGPVYTEWPFPMHKNFVGSVLGFAALIVYARPSWLRWSRGWTLALFWLFVVAILATQARQALVGVAVGLLVVALRPDPTQRRSRVIVWAVVAATAFVASTVREQLESENEFNSAQQRLSWFDDSLTIWHTNEWVGVGLRWWANERTEFFFQPPNAFLEVLTSAGVVGLAGFLILMIGGLVVLWRVEPAYGTLAFAILAMRLVQGQLDLFWSAVVVSVPYAVIGVCLGAQAYAERIQADRQRLLAPPARFAAGSPEPAPSPEPVPASQENEVVRR